MIRRLGGVLAVTCALVAPLAGGASAAAPAGPRLSFFRFGDSGVQIVTSNASGAEQRVVVDPRDGDPIPLGPPAWSANGGRFAFPGVTQDRRDSVAGVFLADADGGNVALVAGTENGRDPVLSPDGHTLAFTRVRGRQRPLPGGASETVYHSVSIWIVRIGSGRARQITPWRNGLSEYPSSFSPNGSLLAVSRVRSRGIARAHYSALAVHLDGSGAGLLANNATEPKYSPDGRHLALITVERPRRVIPRLHLSFTPTDLAVANADGSGRTQLTNTAKAIEGEPSWDPSGERLVYSRHGIGPSMGGSESILEVNADGTCPTRVISERKDIVRGVSWQPGAGREAPPLAC
ncbi:MAG TPA: hypothetical protein VF731_14055 [Solirubrobacterales bacterium]